MLKQNKVAGILEKSKIMMSRARNEVIKEKRYEKLEDLCNVKPILIHAKSLYRTSCKINERNFIGSRVYSQW
jgi:hypothetical protein